MVFRRPVTAILLTAALALATASLLPGNATAAAEPTSLKSVTLWVYPEYDDPRLLVMIEGQAVGSTPTRIRFMVPADAEMYSAGYMDEQGAYHRAPDWDGTTNFKPSGVEGWNIVSFTINNSTFRAEWYHDAIKGLPEKTISYDFKTLYPISDLHVVLQKPMKSSDFHVTPTAQSTGTDSEGFQVSTYTLSNIDVDAAVHYDISYTKSDTKPSLNPPQATTSGSSGTVWLAVGLGAILAAALAFVLRQGATKRRKAMAGSAKLRAAPGRSPAGGAIRFCTGCGSPVQAAASFCPSCGRKLR